MQTIRKTPVGPAADQANAPMVTFVPARPAAPSGQAAAGPRLPVELLLHIATYLPPLRQAELRTPHCQTPQQAANLRTLCRLRQTSHTMAAVIKKTHPELEEHIVSRYFEQKLTLCGHWQLEHLREALGIQPSPRVVSTNGMAHFWHQGTEALKAGLRPLFSCQSAKSLLSRDLGSLLGRTTAVSLYASTVRSDDALKLVFAMLAELPDLRAISMRHCSLFARSMRHLAPNALLALRAMDLSDNHLRAENLNCLDWPNLRHLTSLHLADNALVSVSPQLGLLRQLRFLDLSDNALSTLPTALGSCIRLQTLVLRSNEFDVFPEVLCDLGQLAHLDISRNELRSLPMQLRRLQALRRLSLRKNRLCALPTSLTTLCQLVSLDISWNRLTAPPPAIVDSKLQILRLTYNPLGQILDSSVYRCLRLLDLGDTRLRDADLAHLAWDGLLSLEQLFLGQNSLTHLPDGLWQLRQLRHLDVSENQIRQIAAEIGYLTALRSVDVSENQLRLLPNALVQLPSLRMLEIGGNAELLPLNKPWANCHALRWYQKPLTRQP